MYFIQLLKPAKNDVKFSVGEGNEKKYIEEIFYEKNWKSTGERIQKLLYPELIENYSTFRNKIDSGE